jgi:hypothetical protein
VEVIVMTRFLLTANRPCFVPSPDECDSDTVEVSWEDSVFDEDAGLFRFPVLAAAWPSLDGLGASEVEADMTELC